jgi:hypothetical protein
VKKEPKMKASVGSATDKGYICDIESDGDKVRAFSSLSLGYKILELVANIQMFNILSLLLNGIPNIGRRRRNV